LIENLNKAMGMADDSLASHHAKLVCEGTIGPQAGGALINCLAKLFEQFGTNENSVQNILENLQTTECPTAFYKWAQQNLGKFMLHQQEPTAQKIVFEFIREHWLRTCGRDVPSFRLLQALSFSAYSHVTTIIKDHLAPRLFHINLTTLRMKSFSEDRVRYFIDIDPLRKVFTVTHCKRYNFITGSTLHYTSYGSVDVYWSVRGRQYSTEFSSLIWCDKLRLDAGQPFDTRFQIVEKLGLLPKQQSDLDR
jgi:hypothetical protein